MSHGNAAARTRASRRVALPGALRAAHLALATFALTLAAALAPSAAYAHVPAIEPGGSDTSPESPLEVGGPEVSRAVYGYLASTDTLDAYDFTVPEEVTAEVSVIVPASAETSWSPSLTLRAEGALVATGSPIPGAEPFFEVFSLETFRDERSLTTTFSPGVSYTVHVGHGEGADAGPALGGRYVVVMGDVERFTAREAGDSILALPRIWFGAYGGAPLRWGVIAWFAAAVLALVAGAEYARRTAAARRRRHEEEYVQGLQEEL